MITYISYITLSSRTHLFIFPWILFIANIPGAVITYMALGAVATFSAYIPGLGGSKDS